jgi:hypothetical protein
VVVVGDAEVDLVVGVAEVDLVVGVAEVDLAGIVRVVLDVITVDLEEASVRLSHEVSEEAVVAGEEEEIMTIQADLFFFKSSPNLKEFTQNCKKILYFCCYCKLIPLDDRNKCIIVLLIISNTMLHLLLK